MPDKRHLNLTREAWLQLRRAWGLAPTPLLLWQSNVTGRLLSMTNRWQLNATRKARSPISLAGSVFVLGYWRSGTTLLHELLCLDDRYTYPTTYACMNPHHFMLSKERRIPDASAKRPMDGMTVSTASPQEDEFALLSLGARSPYEALLVPQHLPEALALADPADLPPRETDHWRETFRAFLQGVSLVGDGRPVIAKSPTHSYRVPTIRELVPDARFVLIVRDPYAAFESAVRMWRTMTQTYAVSRLPDENDVRRALLTDHIRFEDKLASGIADLPANRFAQVKFEDLTADPVAAIGGLYDRLELGEFSRIAPRLSADWAARGDYRPRSRLPPEPWRSAVAKTWAPLFSRYGYPAQVT